MEWEHPNAFGNSFVDGKSSGGGDREDARDWDEYCVVSSPGFFTVTARGNSSSPAAEAAGHSDGRHPWSSSSGGIGGGQRRAGGLRLTRLSAKQCAMRACIVHSQVIKKTQATDIIVTSLQGVALLGNLYLKIVSVLEIGAEEVDSPTPGQLVTRNPASFSFPSLHPAPSPNQRIQLISAPSTTLPKITKPEALQGDRILLPCRLA